MPDRWGFNRPWTTEISKVQDYDAVRILDAKGFRITTLFGQHRQDYADMIVKSVNKANIKVSDAKHEDTNPESDDKTDELAADSSPAERENTTPDEAESGEGTQESSDTESEEESEDDEPSGESSSDDDEESEDEDSGVPEKDENETAKNKENPLW